MLIKPLTQREELFVEAYTSGMKYNEAAAAAGFSASYIRKGNVLLKRPQIIAAIDKKYESKKRTFFLAEQDILEGLYREAKGVDPNGDRLTDSTASARITAWVHLGKHIGMFKDKEKEQQQSVTYNVINYNVKDEKIEQETRRALAHLSKEEISDADLIIEIDSDD